MTLTEQLERLAAFEPAPYPVVSLYLNTQAGQHGRDQHQAFIRKEFKARGRTYPQNSAERESLDTDLEKIARYSRNRASAIIQQRRDLCLLRRRTVRGHPVGSAD